MRLTPIGLLGIDAEDASSRSRTNQSGRAFELPPGRCSLTLSTRQATAWVATADTGEQRWWLHRLEKSKYREHLAPSHPSLDIEPSEWCGVREDNVGRS